MVFHTRIDWEQEVPRIIELGKMGMSQVAVAERYGVSRQRIKQITKKYIPQWQAELGPAVNRKLLADTRYAKWGVREDSELYQSKRAKFRNKKARAVGAGIDFTVEFGELDWPTHCPVLGIELDYFAESRQENSVSFDRFDCSKGYISGNVSVVSWRANRLKNDGTAHEHKLIAEWMNKVV